MGSGLEYSLVHWTGHESHYNLVEKRNGQLSIQSFYWTLSNYGDQQTTHEYCYLVVLTFRTCTLLCFHAPNNLTMKVLVF